MHVCIRLALTSVRRACSFLFDESGVRKETLQLTHSSVIRGENAVFVQIARYPRLVAMKIELDGCSRAIVWITWPAPRGPFVDAIPVNCGNASSPRVQHCPAPPGINTLDFFIAQPAVICKYPQIARETGTAGMDVVVIGTRDINKRAAGVVNVDQINEDLE